MLLALTRTEAAARLGVGAVIALAAWLALLGVLAVATRARRPDPGPASMDLGGDEPPALVNFLANGWKAQREAVPATLLDLAARNLLAVEAIGPERFVLRMRAASTGDPRLNPYEGLVLGHVRGLAAGDGTVACEALTTGPDAESKNWWRTFEQEVRRDARARGLSRGRWSGWMTALLAVTALAPAVLAALAVVVVPDHSSSSNDNPVGAFFGIGLIVWVVLLALPGKLRGERDTPEGRAAAARWLGLREYLGDDGSFSEAPPAAVSVWERYLSYGAALGVAPAAVRALPLGAESDTVACSAYGGRWHMVRIDYPKRIPPGWGRHPAQAAAVGLASLLAGLFVARFFSPLVTDAASRLSGSIGDHGLQPLDLLGIAVLGIPALVASVWLLRAALMLVAGGVDLFARREVEGLAVRVHVDGQPYLAVDDGTGRTVRAWLVEPAILAPVHRGSVVHATVSPRLGHVFRVEESPAVAPTA